MDVAAAPTQEGYTFSGWTTTDVSVVNGKFTVTNNVTFTGTWTPIQYDYTVQYYKDSIAPANLLGSEAGTAAFGSAIPFTNGKYVPQGYNANGAVSG